MPITRRRFELGIDLETDRWMRTIYEFLAANNEKAYSHGELIKQFNDPPWGFTNEGLYFANAVKTLVRVGAIEGRTIGNEVYYSWWHEMNMEQWTPIVRV